MKCHSNLREDNEMRKGSDHPNWKGGVTSDQGRVSVSRPGHQRARHKGLYVRRAVLVLEEKLGRSLEPEEVAHHINGITDDDRPENLQVMTNSEHTRLHMSGSACPWYRGDLDNDLIRAEYRKGASSRELAVKYGCSSPTIMRRISVDERREGGGVKKDLDVELIREEYRSGVTSRELAVKFGCSPQTIRSRIPAEERRDRGG